MAYWSSPRRRRRLLWLGAALLAVGGFLAVNAVMPSRGGPVRGSPLDTARGITLSRSDAAERAAADRAEAEARPLANQFVDDLAGRRHLDRAFALLTPRLREHYSQQDWTSGRDLPLTGVDATSGGATAAFSGRTTVGFVASLPPNVLFAVRLDKLPVLGWRVAYVHEGHGSSRISEANYSPAGFAPGSSPNTLGTWLILLGGFTALVVVVALADRRLSRVE